MMFAEELTERDWTRFDDKWSPVESGCHLWLGEGDPRGRGRFSIYNTDGSRMASRSAKHLAWERAEGRSLAAGESLRATCENPGCVNPAHHEAGTRGDVQRAVARARGFDGETCANGHTGHYTVVKTGPYAGTPYCKECRRISARERYWRRKDREQAGEVSGAT